jgi:5'(3')-deoxyribonucleotidase
MIVGLFDVDGVAAAFVNHLLDEIGSKLAPSDIKRWNIRGCLPPDEVDRADEVLSDPHFWMTLPPVPGSQEAIEALQAAGHDIHWVTSPYDLHGWDAIRRSWLRRNFDTPPDHVTITAAKYLVDGDYFVDDKLVHVQRWAACRHKPQRAFLFETPYTCLELWEPKISWEKIKSWV